MILYSCNYIQKIQYHHTLPGVKMMNLPSQICGHSVQHSELTEIECKFFKTLCSRALLIIVNYLGPFPKI